MSDETQDENEVYNGRFLLTHDEEDIDSSYLDMLVADEPEEVEEALKMIETEDEEVILMVEEEVANNRLPTPDVPTSERTAQRLAGQTHAKFKQVRKEKPIKKQKYMGKARRY
jgi:H2-forming N5,N10-methylenetetrahydromethanopterin dehydrogenase-like enzyme